MARERLELGDTEKSTIALQDDDAVDAGPIKKLWTAVSGGVRDGKW